MKKNVASKAAILMLLTSGMLASVAARASTVTLAPFDAAGNATFGLTHPVVGSYVDDFLFSVTPDNIAHASGSAVNGWLQWAAPPGNNYAIQNIQFFMVNPDSSHTAVSTAFSPSTLRFWATGTLAAGNYGFAVSGMTTMAGTGGSYAGNLNVMTTPVPEPSAYLMMIVGVGLLGFASRSKIDNKVG